MSSREGVAELLDQTGWVRALARSLAGDVHLAEDLAQDAWVAALQRPPDHGRSLRGWLATVLRHRWSDVARERARREEREHTGARREELDPADVLVERASIQRTLVGAVLELEEPYRSTVLLRFFEELPQREIARRMRTTTATVNSRLTRALEKLRERLSRRGGSADWLRVLVPLFREPAVAPALALGVAVKSLVPAAIAAITLALGIWMWNTPRAADSAPGAVSAPGARADSAPTGAEPRVVAAPAAGERTAVSGRAAETVPADRAAAAAARRVRGRVVDASGAGRPGVALATGGAESDRSACVSAAGGWFEIELDPSAESIVCSDPRFETVLAGSARVAADVAPTVVVAPRIRLAGIVVDGEARALAGARVGLRLPAGFGAEWGVVLDYSLPGSWTTLSGPDGRFELPAAPALEGATLRATLGGFAPFTAPAPQADAGALELVLARPGSAVGIVMGLVLDPAGSPVRSALVSAGAESSLTDAEGEFALDVTRPETGPRLIAAKSGFLPAVLEAPAGADGRPAWPDRVVLQLGGEPGRARGRVVDHEGRGVPGAKVWIDDPTYFGDVGERRMTTETLLCGDERFWSFATAGADGGFEIGGLLDRAYRLRAIDPRTLATAESAAVRGGDARVEIRLPTDDVHERIAGHVRARDGAPLAGVRVRCWRETFAIDHANGRDNECEESASVTTGADGAFAFESVPRSGINVIASSDGIMSEGLEVDKAGDLLALEIVASRRVHVQVELAEPVGRADSVAFLDTAGRRSYACVLRASGSHASFSFPLVAGRSDVLAVEERTATLLLLLGEVEVARIPLELVPGQVNLVRY